MLNTKSLVISIKNYPWIMSIVGAVLMILVMHFLEPAKPTIATVDITRIVNQFVQSQVKLNLPAKELQQRVKKFGGQLEVTLNAVAKKRHVVLVPAEAVMAGAEDLTAVVQKMSESEFAGLKNVQN